jgi:CHAD domain-containing protein
LAEAAPELVMGPVAADITSALSADRAEANRALEAAMGGRRYRALLVRLDRWRTEPPWTEAADQKASAGQPYVDKAGRKARRRLRQAVSSGEDVDFHRARKAAKRYRYAAELLEPHAGQASAKTVARVKKLQDLLGELQDTVATRAVLVDLGRRMGADAGRNGFTYGLLYACEASAGADIKRRLAKRNG